MYRMCSERNLFNLKMIDDVLWILHSAHGNCFLLIKILRLFRLPVVFATQQISYDVTKYE